MDFLHIAFLIAVGFVAGIVSSLVGGASLVTYPILIATGVPPIAAAVITNTAMVPSNLVAALTDRALLPPVDRGFAKLVIASIVGAAVGAALLMLTPERVFELIVPLLLGFATVLFAYSARIAMWIRRRAERRGQAVALDVTSLKMLLPVSFYGGYFGSGVGILMLGVLSIATHGDYRTANVVKNMVLSLNSIVASIIYVVQGAVLWPPTLALMAGSAVGGYTGAWLSRILPRELIRIIVIGFGAMLTSLFAYRYWL
jgi:uncharacterized membrane protein YfcA